MDDIEKIIPSTVRLERIDVTNRGRRKLLHFSLYSRAFKYVFVFPEREVRSRNICVPISPCEAARRQVKGRPYVVNNVSGDGLNIGWDRAIPRELIDNFTGIRISLGNERAWLGVEERLNGSFEITDMALGPLNF